MCPARSCAITITGATEYIHLQSQDIKTNKNKDKGEIEHTDRYKNRTKAAVHSVFTITGATEYVHLCVYKQGKI